MTDETAPETSPDPSDDVEVSDAESADTGLDAEAEVAAVREQLAGLDDQPVEEHVAVFEEAHRRLRRALQSTRPEE